VSRHRAEADVRAAEEKERLDSKVAQRQEAEAAKPDACSKLNNPDRDIGNNWKREGEDTTEERARERAA